MQLDRAIEYFLTAKQSDNKSQTTIDTYARALYRFAREMPDVQEVEDLDAFSLRTYSVKLQQVPTFNDVTVAHHMRHLKAFVAWCKAEDLLRSNPFEGGTNARVKVPKFKDPERTLITQADLKALLAVCDTTTDLGRRDVAIIMTLYDTGIRCGELVGMKVDDLNLKSRMAKVTGKGNKDRTIYYSAHTALALTRYLSRRRAKSEYVFYGYKRNYDGHIQVSGVEQRMRKLAKRAGVTNPVYPHNFRHTFATNYLTLGGDPATLQAILGHKDISTTVKNYVHMDEQAISQRHNQFSPLAAAMGRR